MRHVTPITANLLRTMSSETYATDYLHDFHEKHWGRQNGVAVTYGSTNRILAIDNNFDLGKGCPILVRECYLGVWEYLRGVYLDVENDEDLPSGHRGTVLYGHPGIGKSVALYILMCAAAEARIPFIFHREPSTGAYVCLEEQAFNIPARLISKLTFTTRALVLVDSSTDAGLSVDVYAARSAHVVLVSPPVPGRYKEFVKYTAALFYTLELPKIAELRAILHLNTLRVGRFEDKVSLIDRSHMSLLDIDSSDEGDSTHTTEQTSAVCDPVELFELCGPNLRFVLSGWTRDAGAPEEPLPRTEKWALVQVGRHAANALARGEWIHSSASVTGYHRLFFAQPDPEGAVTRLPPYNVTIPTPFLRGILRDAVRSLTRERQFAAIHHARRFDAILHGSQPRLFLIALHYDDAQAEQVDDEERAPLLALPPPSSTRTRNPQSGTRRSGELSRRGVPEFKTATNLVQIGPYDFSQSPETVLRKLINGLPRAAAIVAPKVTRCKNDNFVLCKFSTAKEAAAIVSAWQERSPELEDCGAVYVD